MTSASPFTSRLQIARKTGLFVAAAAAAVALSACQTTKPAPATGDVLGAAGFAKKVADTPARQAKLAKAPAGQLISRKVKGKTYYVYADPKDCICVYVGDEAAYQNFQDLARRHSLSPMQTVVTEMNRDADWNFNALAPGQNW